jgi:hypothetical protein
MYFVFAIFPSDSDDFRHGVFKGRERTTQQLAVHPLRSLDKDFVIELADIIAVEMKALLVELFLKRAAGDAVVNRYERADLGLVKLFLVFGDAWHYSGGFRRV